MNSKILQKIVSSFLLITGFLYIVILKIKGLLSLFYKDRELDFDQNVEKGKTWDILTRNSK
ncbi:MAG: hypothetical protein M0R46_00285 [Candidatus Muirbacterium halophilum]|nr:hypothetical protein [Candidatus Muirbacterium halophilum]MCK9474330.1 hypothetical protein [Candidatus Muirbacterium halophilum]